VTKSQRAQKFVDEHVVGPFEDGKDGAPDPVLVMYLLIEHFFQTHPGGIAAAFDLMQYADEYYNRHLRCGRGRKMRRNT